MSFLLIKALEKLLQDGFSQSRFRVPDYDPGEYIAPQFFIGAVPPKRKNNDPLHDEKPIFPYIVNRFKEGEDSDSRSVVTIRTICGVYTAGDVEAGENDVANMVMLCRRLILEKQLLDNRYELDLPLKWYLGDKEDLNRQAHPYYGGEIITTWEIPTIERTISIEEEENIYGS